MYSDKEAIEAAKNLVEFCSNQFCPDCVFNQGRCMLGGLGITPKAWNEGNALINLTPAQDIQAAVEPIPAAVDDSLISNL